MQPPSRWTRRACRSAILIEPRADLPQAITLGVDKAYDDRGFRQRVALDEGDAACGAEYGWGSSAIDGRTTRHDGYASRQSTHPQSNRRSLSSRPHFDDAIGSDGYTASPLMRLAEAVAGVSVSAQAHCQVTAAGGLSRPTFAIANISLSVRADDEGRLVSTLLQRAARHEYELAETVPRVLHLMWACANEAGGYHA